MANNETHPVSYDEIQRAVKLTSVLQVLFALYGVLCGGMFITAFALKLGANPAQIGLMTTLPMLCIVVQIPAAILIERGLNRKRWTFIGVAGYMSLYFLIALLPFVFKNSSPNFKIYILIGIITGINLLSYFAGSVRAHWFGDIFPARQLGGIYARFMMIANIVALVFGILSGWLMDVVKNAGLEAFSILFIVGGFIGIIGATLYLPQADKRVVTNQPPEPFGLLFKSTLKNKSLMAMMGWSIMWGLTVIAGPFYSVYMLEKLKMPLLGVSITTYVPSLAIFLGSMYWGKLVDRFGCKAVLTLCCLMIVPINVAWIWVNSPILVYYVIIPVNLISGFAAAGVTVSASTMLYKITPNAGRAMQFAIYSIIVTLICAPAPTLGGLLPSLIAKIGLNSDVRITFYIASFFVLISAIFASKIQEENSSELGEVTKEILNPVAKLFTFKKK